MTKVTGFLQKVLAKLTGGDEAKIARFQAKTIKILKGQINVRNVEVEDLNEKINDLNEKYQETLIDVDLDAIKNSDGLDTYVQRYVSRLQAVKNEIVAVEKKITSAKEEIAKFEALVADLA